MRRLTGLLIGLILTLAGAPPAGADGGCLLVGNKSAHTLWALDLADGDLRLELPTGVGPHEVAVSPDGRFAVVADYGDREPGHTLTVIDWPAALVQTSDSEAAAVLGRDGTIVRTIDLGADTRPHGLAFLPDGRLAVTTEGSEHLLVIDVARGEVLRRIPVGGGIGHMTAVSPDGRTAWVTHIRAGTLTRVDLEAGAATGVVETGAGAEGVGVTPDGREVWVTNRADDTVSVVDAASLEILATLPSPGFPIRVSVAPDGRHMLVTNARAATLSVFDVARRETIATVALAQEGAEYKPTLLGQAALPIGVTMAPDGSRAFVAISGADQVAVIDAGTWRVTDLWTTGREPDALGVIGAGP